MQYCLCVFHFYFSPLSFFLYIGVCSKPRLLSLSQLYDCQILLFVHKLLHADKLPLVFSSYIAQNRSIYQYNTRGKVNLYLNTPHSTFGKKNYLSIKAVFCGTTYQKNSSSLKTQLHLKNYLENILLNVLINLLWTCT